MESAPSSAVRRGFFYLVCPSLLRSKKPAALSLELSWPWLTPCAAGRLPNDSRAPSYGCSTSTQDQHTRAYQPLAPGESGNPAGRLRGSRNKLTEEVICALLRDFRQHGQKAVARVRQTEAQAGGPVKVIEG